MPGIFPNQTVQNDRRVQSFDVIPFVNHPAPPSLAHVVGELDAQRTVVPGAAETAVDFRRWIDKAASFGERDNRFNAGCRHFSMNPDVEIVFKFSEERISSVSARADSSKGAEPGVCVVADRGHPVRLSA